MHGSNCTPKCWLHSLVFQGLQLLASGCSMQFTSNTKMTKLQMRFQIMIIMNVLFMMHWIVGGIEVEM
jgi:hypothetical protein